MAAYNVIFSFIFELAFREFCLYIFYKFLFNSTSGAPCMHKTLLLHGPEKIYESKSINFTKSFRVFDEFLRFTNLNVLTPWRIFDNLTLILVNSKWIFDNVKESGVNLSGSWINLLITDNSISEIVMALWWIFDNLTLIFGKFQMTC